MKSSHGHGALLVTAGLVSASSGGCCEPGPIRATGGHQWPSKPEWLVAWATAGQFGPLWARVNKRAATSYVPTKVAFGRLPSVLRLRLRASLGLRVLLARACGTGARCAPGGLPGMPSPRLRRRDDPENP